MIKAEYADLKTIEVTPATPAEKAALQPGLRPLAQRVVTESKGRVFAYVYAPVERVT